MVQTAVRKTLRVESLRLLRVLIECMVPAKRTGNHHLAIERPRQEPAWACVVSVRAIGNVAADVSRR